MKIDMNLLTKKNAVVLKEILKKEQTIDQLADHLGITYAGARYHLTIILSVYKVRNRRELRQLFKPERIKPRVILRKSGTLPYGVEQ